LEKKSDKAAVTMKKEKSCHNSTPEERAGITLTHQ